MKDARTPSIADWFKFRPRRIEELDPSKPLNPTLTEERVLALVSELAPALSGKDLMCPCCHKQMRPALLFSVNKDLVIFSLNCCFGQATMAAVTSRELEGGQHGIIAGKLAADTRWALANLKQIKPTELNTL